MTGFSTRSVLKLPGGAAAGGALAGGSAAAAAATATPEEVQGETNPMVLWYRRPAQERLEALAVGNGRLDAMVFGGVTTEHLQLNEDSIWADGPHDYADPDAHTVVEEIRSLINQEKWLEAQNLADRRFMGEPTEHMQYQPVGNLELSFRRSPMSRMTTCARWICGTRSAVWSTPSTTSAIGGRCCAATRTRCSWCT